MANISQFLKNMKIMRIPKNNSDTTQSEFDLLQRCSTTLIYSPFGSPQNQISNQLEFLKVDYWFLPFLNVLWIPHVGTFLNCQQISNGFKSFIMKHGLENFKIRPPYSNKDCALTCKGVILTKLSFCI